MFAAFKARRPWAAALITLVFGPVVGMLYLNRWIFAIIYLFTEILVTVLLLAAFPLGSALGVSLSDLSLYVDLPIRCIGITHSVIIAIRRQPAEKLKWFSRWYAIVGLVAVLPFSLFLLVRIFLFQPFNIRAVSMSPTLNVGDYFLVSKWAYWKSQSRRGDIVVFYVPKLGVHYVKRLIGLPGDHIQLKNGVLYINGVAAREQRVGNFVGRCANGPCAVPQYVETLPSGRTEHILRSGVDGPSENTDVFIVPPGHYFVLGDNRDNSVDSRNLLGFVRREQIVGRPSVRYIAAGHWVWQPIDTDSYSH